MTIQRFFSIAIIFFLLGIYVMYNGLNRVPFRHMQPHEQQHQMKHSSLHYEHQHS